VLLALWRAFLTELNDRQKIQWNECFVDGSFAPAEVTRLEQTLASQPTCGTAEGRIADRGYDSNGPRRLLKRRGIQPILPARRNNAQATNQDGRCLRRYRRRRIV
jgi:hypothetical protein